MIISVDDLVQNIVPRRTVLFFGAGSSRPSGAPSVDALKSHLAERFKLETEGFDLSELATLAEKKPTKRRGLIDAIREKFKNLKATGGLLNLPLYEWRSIFTTNYDRLIEETYERRDAPYNVYTSNFDFTVHADGAVATKVFKLHGTIEKDIVDGDKSRIIISGGDYDQTSEYRENLYSRLKSDLAGAQLVIIGHSLADKHIREIANEVAAINTKIELGGQIILLLYTEDKQRAELFEERGINVCFAGIDEFFAALAKTKAARSTSLQADDLLGTQPALVPVTFDIDHASHAVKSDFSAMFNGWPATHADILASLTFERSVAAEIVATLNDQNFLSATLLGASGVGKTTAVRQALQKLRAAGSICWEHNADHPLQVKSWLALAAECKVRSKLGVLLIDDAHSHLYEVNELAERLASDGNEFFKLLIISATHLWSPRVKSPVLFQKGKQLRLVQLSADEIERLLNLIDSNSTIGKVVEPMFSGFSRTERRRRLVERCSADMFVCLKNIFASESFDDIILREYAVLERKLQDIYRYVAAMENAGIRVHRQLLIRILGIPAGSIGGLLNGLTEIVSEYPINEREGVFGWRTRHLVIADIVTRFKFADIDAKIALFDLVIMNLRPTYDIEVRTIRELCNIDSGIPCIPDKEVQNTLFRKLMSVAPAERVPRHRLIRNLIESGAYDKADTEIRIFEKDFNVDGPVYRYKVELTVARAKNSPGILKEDRIQILETGRELALIAMNRVPNNKGILSAYASLGVEYYRLTGSLVCFEDAIAALKKAEDEVGDPDISKIISRFSSRVYGKG